MKNTSFYKNFLKISLFSVLSVFFACSTEGTGDNSSNSTGDNGNSSSEIDSGNPSSSSFNGDNGNSSSEVPNNPSSSSNGGNGGGEIGSHAALPNQNPNRVSEMYDSWINTYYITYEDDPAKDIYADAGNIPEKAIGTARIKAVYSNRPSSGQYTCSEAIGYGMILTALMGDFDKFDKLLAYSKAFRVSNTVALMRWDVNTFFSASGGSATDADIDILAALFIAYKKTNNQSYLNDAIEIGASIYEWEVHADTKLILPARNTESNLGSGRVYNISYFSLVALKMLAIYDNSHDWASVLEANLAHMEMVQNNGNLWPDWNDASGVPTDPNNSSNQSLSASDGTKVDSYAAYYKETPRIPWRIAWYYHWFGDERAKAMLDKGMAFLQGKGVSAIGNLKHFYSYSDDREGSAGVDQKIWASLCALGMGSSANADWLNLCNDRLTGNYNPVVSNYYGNSLQLIYAMLFNGKF